MTRQMDDTQIHPRILMLASPADFVDEMPNIGDRALQRGLRDLIKDNVPGAQILEDEWNTFPFETFRHTQRSGVPIEKSYETFEIRAAARPSIQLALYRMLLSSAADRTPMMPRLDRWARRRTGQNFRQAIIPRLFPKLVAGQFAAKLAASDVAIMNAGGLLSDHLAHYLPGRILSLHAAKQAGLRVAVVNYSFSILENETLRRLVRPTLQAIDFHVVRESQSREALIELGVDKNRIVVSRDTAFYTNFGPAEPVTCRPRIATFVRGDRPVDVPAWSALVNWMRAELDVEVIYLHGCHKDDPAVRAALDAACKLDNERSPLDNTGTMRALSECALVVSDRYHGLVFAIQAEVPIVPIASTTHKTAGLLKDLGLSLPVLPSLRADHLERYKTAIRHAYEARKSLTRDLAGQAAMARKTLVDDYRSVFGCLGLMSRR